MANFFTRIWQSIFGGGETEAPQQPETRTRAAVFHEDEMRDPVSPASAPTPVADPVVNEPATDTSAGQPTGNPIPDQIDVSPEPGKLLVDVIRYSTGPHDTLGRMYFDGKAVCYTLEDTHRDQKVFGETRIPAGDYEVTLRTEGGKHATYHLRFRDMHKGMLWVRNVPNFKYILIHLGNTKKDSHGCILVGESTYNEDKPQMERQIWHSVKAYRRVYPVMAQALLDGKEVRLRIKDVG